MRIDIIGQPEPQARPRVRRRGIIGATIYSPKSHWRQLVAFEAARFRYGAGERIAVPCEVRLFFRMTRPKRLPKAGKPHAGRPDIDNLAKSTIDGLCPAVLHNDTLITRLVAEKRYAEVGEQPGCVIEILPQEKKEAKIEALSRESGR